MSRSALLALSLVFTAAAVRLFPHPDNFAPVGAMGLFCAAYLRHSWGLAVPFVALFLSDLVLNNVIYSAYFPTFAWFTSIWIYLSFAAVLAVGILIFQKSVSPTKVLAASLTASLVFFLVSNFSTFVETNLYPKNAAGLLACYTAGLPFLKNTILGDLFFSAVMFGTYSFYLRTAEKKINVV